MNFNKCNKGFYSKYAMVNGKIIDISDFSTEMKSSVYSTFS